MAKWLMRSSEHEVNPLQISGWLNFFKQRIPRFTWSQYDNPVHFQSLEEILKVLNTTNESVARIITSDFPKGTYMRNQSGDIILSKELQESIVMRLRELLAPQEWGKIWIEEIPLVSTLETVLEQIESFWTKTMDKWIIHFCPEWRVISEKIFDRIVKQAIRIIVAKTKNRVSEKNIISRITNAHYKMEWENITMSTELETQIQLQIQQISDNISQTAKEGPERLAMALSLKPQSALLTMENYIIERRKIDPGFTLTSEIWNMIWNSFPDWFDKIKYSKKKVIQYELKVSCKTDFERFVHQLIAAVTSALPVSDYQGLGWISSPKEWQMRDIQNILLSLVWGQVAWRREIGLWLGNWGDVNFPTQWKKTWSKPPLDSAD